VTRINAAPLPLLLLAQIRKRTQNENNACYFKAATFSLAVIPHPQTDLLFRRAHSGFPFLRLTPGRSPFVNSTPAASKARQLAGERV
jgi:hypothetical protein